MLSIDSDLGRHLTLGNYILDNRIIPTRDIFSHTLTNQPRPPYEWLAQILFAISNNLLALDGVILLTALLISASIGIVFLQSFRRSRSPLIALLVSFLAAAATSIHWLPRPHVVTFILLGLWVNELERLRAQEKTNLFVFPFLMLFWANLHGGFIFGFLALGAYFGGWAWEARKKEIKRETGKSLFMAGILSLAASILTPGLWRNWEAVLNNRSAFILSRTVETMPPDFSNPSVMPFAMLLVLAVILAFANRRDLPASHVLLLAGLGLISVLMARNIPLFAIVCAPILAVWVSKVLNRLNTWKNIEARFAFLDKPIQFSLIPILVVAISAGYFKYSHANGREIYQFNPQVFPVHAVDWLETHPMEGNMFNEFNWGGYLLFRRWPRELVFLDSQTDFYGEELVRDYETIVLAQDQHESLLNKYNVDWVIISVQSPLASTLTSDTDWLIAYQDSVAIILYRR